MANNQISEQELQFRKRARRRLVGAVALVLLMVTVLPMILDDRGVKTPQPEISISIPSQDGASFNASSPPIPPAAAPVTALAEPLAAPLQEVAAKIEPQPAQAPLADKQTVDKPQVERPVVDKVSAAVEKVAEKPVPVEKAVEKPAAIEKPPEPVAAQSEPVAAKAPAAAKPAAKNGTFFVQVGVFAESPKFKQLETKLAAKGFHPLREKMDTPKGEKIRLRIGPFSTRANADAAMERLKSIDVTGMIVSSK